MRKLKSLSISNVRCFEGKHSISLGKITLLVGENSTGKSTLLACCKALSALANFHNLDDPQPSMTPNLFDMPPFHLGNFSNIARHGESTFSLSASFASCHHAEIDLTYGKAPSGVPTEQELTICVPTVGGLGRLTIRPDRVNGQAWHLAGEKFGIQLPADRFSYREPSAWLSGSVRNGVLPFGDKWEDAKHQVSSTADQFARLTNFLRKDLFPWPEIIRCIAPTPRAMERSRSYADRPFDPWNGIVQKGIANSANKLGIFEGIKLDETPGGSFELSVKRHGRWFNILDVGYGVASLLTLLHEMHSGPESKVFFLQQPEAHVHPSAQAELAELMVESSDRFVIETHSDHLIDRFCICVMKGQLAPDELKIVYLEKDDAGRTNIHNLDVDRQGNILNVPVGYRQFFLDEASRLMGLD